MSIMSAISALTEASTGYYGGPAVDSMPYLSLEEACGELTIGFPEHAMESIAESRKQNEMIVEATMRAVMSESAMSESEMQSLSEGVWASVKAQVQKFWAWLKKTVSSIIAKIKVMIDKFRMTGKQLVAKYKTSRAITEKDFKNLTYNGYKFIDNISAFGKSSDIAPVAKGAGGATNLPDLDKLMHEIDGIPLEAGVVTEEASKEVRKKISKFTDLDRNDMKFNMLKQLIGSAVTVSKDSWVADIKKYLRGGEKGELKYSTNFTKESVIRYIESPDDLIAMENEYAGFAKVIDTEAKNMTDMADSFDRDKASDEKDNGTKLDLKASAYRASAELVQEAASVIASLKAAKVAAAKEKAVQYKSIFGKMLTYSPSKSDTNSFDLEDAEDYDFDM